MKPENKGSGEKKQQNKTNNNTYKVAFSILLSGLFRSGLILASLDYHFALRTYDHK